MQTFYFGRKNFYAPDPQTVDEVKCGICGSICDVERNCCGPTTWTMAMEKSERHYDRFSCPLMTSKYDNGLHQQIEELKKEIKKTHSPSLKEIMEKDLDEFIKEVRQLRARVSS